MADTESTTTRETLESAAHGGSFELSQAIALLEAVVDAMMDTGTDGNNMLLTHMALEKVTGVHTRLAPHI